MNYTKWKAHLLEAIGEKLRVEGFVPEAVRDFLAANEEMLDMAYSYGRKDEQDDAGEG